MFGPHGPVSPAGPQKFSFASRNAILSFGNPNAFHASADSVSFGAFLSPLKTETASLSAGTSRIFVMNSYVISIASFLK